MKKFGLILLCLVIVALIAGYVVVYTGQSSDSDQITAVMERGRQSIERKSASGVASCISKNYSDELGANRDKICASAAQAFTAQCNYEVLLSAPEITVTGNEAEAKTHVKLSSVTGSDKTEQISSDLVLHFKKEPARRFLIYPTQQWKVVKIEGISSALDLGL